MKYKKHEDNVRHSLERWDSHQYFIKQVKLSNIFNWKDAEITFNSPVSVITGRNGTGKSTLINSIKYAKNLQQNITDIGILSTLERYKIFLINQSGQEIIVEDKKIIKNQFKIPKITDLTFNSTIYSFYRDSSTESINSYRATLESFDSIPMEKEFLDVLRELLEKPITSALIKIDDEEDRFYHSLTLEDGTVYDSYSMGSGEFYINQFLWGIKNLQDRGIVLIEELENYIHPEAQKKIIELIHIYSITKTVQFIITTHSPIVIDHVNNHSLCLLRPCQKNLVSINKCPKWLAKDVLGKKIENKIIVFLEDKKSIALFKTILSHHDRRILRQLIIIDAGGESGVKKFVESHNQFEIPKVIGIVDGDSKEKEFEFFIKLPENSPPEKIVFDCICKNIHELAEKIGKPEKEVNQAFESAKTVADHHEWVSNVCYDLGEDQDGLWIVFTKIWCQKNAELARAFYVKFYKQFEELAKK